MRNVLELDGAQFVGSKDTDVEICVIVNTFNHAGFIGECLDSILSQVVDCSIKILIHDDKSTDGTVEILLQYQAEHPEKILLVLESENQWSQGISNLVTIIPWIESTYIALCEGDDFWMSPLKLQKQIDSVMKDDAITLVYHSIAIQTDDDELDYGSALNYLNIPHNQKNLGRGNFVSTCSVLFRNKTIGTNVLMGMRNLLPVDWIIFAALADVGKVIFIPEIMATYRIHSGSSWSSKNQDWRATKTREVHWYIAGLLQGEIGAEARKALAEERAGLGISGRLTLKFFRTIRRLTANKHTRNQRQKLHT